MTELTVTSPLFESGGWIPDCCAGYGEDASPRLCVDGLPDGAAALAIVMDDLDHPIQPGFNHWIAWNLPPVRAIPGGLPRGAVIEAPLHAEQGIAYGKHAYRGPRPPFNWLHRYRFTVYALDGRLELPADSRREALLRAMEGHVLARGELTGKYRRIHS